MRWYRFGTDFFDCDCDCEKRKMGAVKKSKNERMRGVEGSQSPLVGCYWATDREK